MKKVMVNSCSHSHGWPSMRVAMSHTTVTVKPVMATPQSTISTCSRASSARHLRRRCDCRTSEMAAPLLHAAYQPEDLDRVGAKILGDLVLHRRGDLLEVRLVYAVDDLHAHLLQLGAGLALELEGTCRLAAVHLVGRFLDP